MKWWTSVWNLGKEMSNRCQHTGILLHAAQTCTLKLRHDKSSTANYKFRLQASCFLQDLLTSEFEEAGGRFPLVGFHALAIATTQVSILRELGSFLIVVGDWVPISAFEDDGVMD